MAIPRTLREKLQAGLVVPFVGAGVSMAVKDKYSGENLFPSWKQLLLTAADKLEADNQIPAANLVRNLLSISPPDYLDAAKRAQQALGGRLYGILKDQIDKQKSQADTSSLELARLVWELGSSLVITTNYDRVLEWTAPNGSDCRALDNHARSELAQLVSASPTRSTVWHLHGHIDDTANLVLTPNGYERLYASEGAKSNFEAALATLRNLITSRTLLFVGYSLDDEKLTNQLKAIHDMFAGGEATHFALISQNQADLVRRMGLPVQVISYEHHGEPLLALLREMAHCIAPTNTPPPAPATPTISVADFDPSHPSFNVPYRPKGKQVLGRQEALDNVRKQLTSGNATAIGQAAAFQGIGGLGKTQLAVEYAHDYRNEYPNGVIWLNADSDIDSQLTELAQTSHWVSPQSEHKDKLAIALHRLRSYSDCLVIFDNVEDNKPIDAYLPQYPANPHILITSRTPQSGFVAVPLDVLAPDISLQLLIQEANRRPANELEWAAAKQIVDMLGDLPLAIELAGAFIQHRGISWAKYLALLQTNFAAALPSNFRLVSFTKHEADLYHTLHIDESLFEDEPLLEEILNILTWSGAAPMGQELLAKLISVNAADIEGALGLGVTFRLLQVQTTPTGESYSIHRLVRQVRQAEFPLEEHISWAETLAQCLGNWFESKRQDFANLPDFEREFEHLSTWQNHALQFFPQEASRLLWLQAYPPYHRGRYYEAQEIVKKSLSIYELSTGNNRQLRANLLNDKGSLEGLQSYQPQKALELHQQALEIRRAVFGENHPDTATSLSNIANVYQNLNQPQKALELHQQALEIRRAVLGENHPDTAISLSNIANVYRDLNQPQKALELNQQALEIRRAVLGENHPATATSLGNIANVYQDLNQPQKALELHQQALEIRRAVFGENHPDTATSLGNIANVYQDLNQPQKALELHQQALEIRRAVLGENHPATAISLSNIASVYRDLNQPQKALELNQQALEIRRAVLGENHPDTATSLGNIANVYQDLNQPQKALELHQQALEIRRAVLGENHPDTATSLGNIANVYQDLNQPQKALELHQQALEIRRAVLGENHPATAISLSNIASVYRDLNQPQKALELNQQALEIHRSVLGENHPDTAISLNNIASVYFDEGNFETSSRHLRQAYEINLQIWGKVYLNTLDSLRNLCISLEEEKKYKEAFNLLDETLQELPSNHPQFEALETRALKLLRAVRGKVNITPYITHYKNKWRKAKKS